MKSQSVPTVGKRANNFIPEQGQNVGRQNEVLTDRQLEISGLLAAGRNNKEIANQLGISRRTVEDHRSAIYDRMGVRNVVELTRKILGAA